MVADTTEEALAKQERWLTDPRYIEYTLAEISSITRGECPGTTQSDP
jgi:hypothetical protein